MLTSFVIQNTNLDIIYSKLKIESGCGREMNKLLIYGVHWKCRELRFKRKAYHSSVPG